MVPLTAAQYIKVIYIEMSQVYLHYTLAKVLKFNKRLHWLQKVFQPLHLLHS